MIIFTIIQVLFHKYSFCSPVILHDITIFFPGLKYCILN